MTHPEKLLKKPQTAGLNPFSPPHFLPAAWGMSLSLGSDLEPWGEMGSCTLKMAEKKMRKILGPRWWWGAMPVLDCLLLEKRKLRIPSYLSQHCCTSIIIQFLTNVSC